MTADQIIIELDTNHDDADKVYDFHAVSRSVFISFSHPCARACVKTTTTPFAHCSVSRRYDTELNARHARARSFPINRRRHSRRFSFPIDRRRRFSFRFERHKKRIRVTHCFPVSGRIVVVTAVSSEVSCPERKRERERNSVL